jgi:hypothetical protein
MIVGGVLITMAFIAYLSHRTTINETVNKNSLKYYKLRWRSSTPF